MFVIGLTGGIGSGKSTVSRWLSEHGIPIIDADQTVHELYDAPETIAAIAAAFGHGIVTDEGRINRRALGSIVFADDFALRQLEQILHPLVRRDMLKQQETIALAGQKVCIWDVPLLFEAGFHEHMDEIWVVWVPADTQKERVMRRDAFTLGEVELRMQAQFSLDEKRKKADVVIDNSGNWQQTELQLRKEMERIIIDHGL
ncbi:dephospho-CoA kinase [Desulfitobacterium dichloroeliminans LMG P-21439]|uniref:Dephospho-CoA kinase n=1 Tax=Desulfitobacterium dichloroeliminans (strain LMG P-21439 / DCA1) TaxID=871963 RepID=L0F838_DESDL|nr:dephospho-CoA kinase [Desulfitobacterium dichloroeliminans]AGA69098.1 dephospho-CoA kinase [Desulfitobacterium dichloroeliminans LMG P-21439]